MGRSGRPRANPRGDDMLSARPLSSCRQLRRPASGLAPPAASRHGGAIRLPLALRAPACAIPQPASARLRHLAMPANMQAAGCLPAQVCRPGQTLSSAGAQPADPAPGASALRSEPQISPQPCLRPPQTKRYARAIRVYFRPARCRRGRARGTCPLLEETRESILPGMAPSRRWLGIPIRGRRHAGRR